MDKESDFALREQMIQRIAGEKKKEPVPVEQAFRHFRELVNEFRTDMEYLSMLCMDMKAAGILDTVLAGNCLTGGTAEDTKNAMLGKTAIPFPGRGSLSLDSIDVFWTMDTPWTREPKTSTFSTDIRDVRSFALECDRQGVQFSADLKELDDSIISLTRAWQRRRDRFYQEMDHDLDRLMVRQCERAHQKGQTEGQEDPER